MILESMTKKERKSAFDSDYDELYYQCCKLQQRKTDTINRRVVNYRSKNNNDYILVPILMYSPQVSVMFALQYEPICTYVDNRGVKRYYKYTQLGYDGTYELVELTTHLLKRVRERIPRLPEDFDALAAWCFERICTSHLATTNSLIANPDKKGSSLICTYQGLFILEEFRIGKSDNPNSINVIMTFLSCNELENSYKYRKLYKIMKEYCPKDDAKYFDFFCNEDKKSRTVLYDVSKRFFFRL